MQEPWVRGTKGTQHFHAMVTGRSHLSKRISEPFRHGAAGAISGNGWRNQRGQDSLSLESARLVENKEYRGRDGHF